LARTLATLMLMRRTQIGAPPSIQSALLQLVGIARTDECFRGATTSTDDLTGHHRRRGGHCGLERVSCWAFSFRRSMLLCDTILVWRDCRVSNCGGGPSGLWSVMLVHHFARPTRRRLRAWLPAVQVALSYRLATRSTSRGAGKHLATRASRI